MNNLRFRYLLKLVILDLLDEKRTELITSSFFRLHASETFLNRLFLVWFISFFSRCHTLIPVLVVNGF